MKKIFSLWIGLVLVVSTALAQNNILRDASKLEQQGKFKEAAAELDAAIKTGKYSGEPLKKLEFDRDRLERIKKDYSMTRDDLYKELKGSLRDLTPEEFDKWVAQGWFDSRDIDGKTWFVGDSESNLYFRHQDLDDRRIHAKPARELEDRHMENIRAIKQAAAAQHTPYVLPVTFEVSMAVKAKAGAAPDGQMIRAWVPIPRKTPFQDDFKLVSSAIKPISIDRDDSPIRSVYFEQVAQAGKPADFSIEYDFTIHGVHFDLDPAKIQPYGANDEAVKKFTGETAHVVFSPDIIALSKKIVGGETNPMLKAKKIYDWQADHLLYSYALEYSTIRNLSEYCRAKGYGDCGQQAILFITLCRYNGIPARWQTGWNLFPGDTTMHDWSEIYLAPYGWMPVDPYMGNYAMRYTKTLSAAGKQELRDFYFGGLDQYRMIANSDHSQVLNPPKNTIRSDDIDFQRGEMEYGSHNIYVDEFSHHLTYKILPETKLP